jgi:hypothetical protein
MLRVSMNLLLLCGVTIATSNVALADCESDLVQLEQAYKTPALSATAKAVLDAAKTSAVAALKKDDDATCHKAVADGLAKSGVNMK